jgi:allophanate hydrolase subunit 2
MILVAKKFTVEFELNQVSLQMQSHCKILMTGGSCLNRSATISEEFASVASLLAQSGMIVCFHSAVISLC